MSSKKPVKNLRTEFFDPIQEGMLVTGMIYHPESISEVMKTIFDSKAFQDENIRKIYEAICQTYEERSEVSVMSIIQRLGRNGDFGVLAKASLSLEFDMMTPNTFDSVVSTAEGLVSMYRRQIAYDLNLKMNGALFDGITDDSLAEMAYGLYEKLTMRGGLSMEKTSKQAAMGALSEIGDNMKKWAAGKITGIPTGSAILDREIGGWQNDEVIIIAARPGQLKTACALDAIDVAASQGFPVGVFSMEMDAEKLNYRLAAKRAKIPYSQMIKGPLSHEEYTRIETALCEIAELPIYYCDDPAAKNIHKLEAVAREWCRKYGIKMAVIDYIQYLQAEEKKSKREEIIYVSQSIKSLQRSLKIPFIALAQLGKDVDKRPDPRPQMEDLSETSQLEQDASTIIGLFNPTYYIRKGKKDIVDEASTPYGMPFPENVMCMYLLKRRSGGNHSRIDRYVDAATNRFSDHDNLHQSPQFPTNKSFDGFQHKF